MTRNRFSRSIALAASLTLALGVSCSFMVDFDLEGKPCDDQGHCLDGYVCSKDQVCIAAEDVPTGDAGLRDAGRPDAR